MELIALSKNTGGSEFQLDTIPTAAIKLSVSNGTSNLAQFTPFSSVELYYKNSKKLETNGIGVTVYNQLDATNLDATNLNISGVSTFAGAVDLNAGLDIDGQLDVDELVVAGVSTFSNAVDINSTLDVDGDTQLDDLNVAGVATFSSLVDANNRLDVAGGANLDQLNVAGSINLWRCFYFQ